MYLCLLENLLVLDSIQVPVHSVSLLQEAGEGVEMSTQLDVKLIRILFLMLIFSLLFMSFLLGMIN